MDSQVKWKQTVNALVDQEGCREGRAASRRGATDQEGAPVAVIEGRHCGDTRRGLHRRGASRTRRTVSRSVPAGPSGSPPSPVRPLTAGPHAVQIRLTRSGKERRACGSWPARSLSSAASTTPMSSSLTGSFMEGSQKTFMAASGSTNTVIISHLVDNSQSMTVADFIAKRGKHCISCNGKLYLFYA
ncbi:hypothetical protein GUJ93_ZPchr0010g10368 [Zizania palustris]|uniref:Uncharacterized protein n=1 Tax=Zizania palustris TaxID=103762 RepID=A0A8J5WAX4_ZIZPA|nr:hypothetical protein GUJ93_ZPchr0010g10368 [Zizania palustris]